MARELAIRLCGGPSSATGGHRGRRADLDVPVGTCVGLLGPSGFDRRLTAGDQPREVTLEPAQIRWLDAQTHSGENIGATPTHVVFVELKGEAEARTAPPTLGQSEQ
jgi:hypothetical protein